MSSKKNASTASKIILNPDKRLGYDPQFAAPLTDATVVIVGNAKNMAKLIVHRPIGGTTLDKSRDWVISTEAELSSLMATSNNPFDASISKALFEAAKKVAVKHAALTLKNGDVYYTEIKKTRAVFLKDIKNALKAFLSHYPAITPMRKSGKPPARPKTNLAHAVALWAHDNDKKADDPYIRAEAIFMIAGSKEVRIAELSAMGNFPYNSFKNEVTEEIQEAVPGWSGTVPSRIRGLVLRRIAGTTSKTDLKEKDGNAPDPQIAVQAAADEDKLVKDFQAKVQLLSNAGFSTKTEADWLNSDALQTKAQDIFNLHASMYKEMEEFAEKCKEYVTQAKETAMRRQETWAKHNQPSTK